MIDYEKDTAWVPRETYDILMDKLDAANLENQRLINENRRLKKACSASVYEDWLPIGTC